MFTYDGRSAIKEENNEILYVLVVNGQHLTAPASKQITEQHIQFLNEEDKKTAKVIPVTSTGKHVLME